MFKLVLISMVVAYASAGLIGNAGIGHGVLIAQPAVVSHGAIGIGHGDLGGIGLGQGSLGGIGLGHGGLGGIGIGHGAISHQNNNLLAIHPVPVVAHATVAHVGHVGSIGAIGLH